MSTFIHLMRGQMSKPLDELGGKCPYMPFLDRGQMSEGEHVRPPGKTYGQYIDYSEKKKWPKGFICPYTETIFYIIRIYSRSQVSVYRTIGPLVAYSLALFLNSPVINNFQHNIKEQKNLT